MLSADEAKATGRNKGNPDVLPDLLANVSSPLNFLQHSARHLCCHLSNRLP